MMRVKRICALVLVLGLLVSLAACSSAASNDESTLSIAAAASLEQVLEGEIIPLFEAQHTDISVSGMYGGSYQLRTQIELGLQADLFFPASMGAMTGLYETVLPLLTNTLVLIAPRDADLTVTGFADIQNAETIAIGDPSLVPAGRYAEEVLTQLGIWDTVQERAHFGTSVSAVLNWVASGSADVGIVYLTDAMLSDQVTIIAEAPTDSLSTPIIYPVGILRDAPNQAAARLFLAFLQSADVQAIFEAHGFAVY